MVPCLCFCGARFETPKSLNHHEFEAHSNFAICVLPDQSERVLQRTDSAFYCLCVEPRKYTTSSGFLKHVRSGKCSDITSMSIRSMQETEEITESDEDLDGSIIEHSKPPAKPKIPPIESTTIPTTKRDYNSAILYACNGNDWGSMEQDRLLGIMDLYDLQPISLTMEGAEENALTHKTHLNAYCQHQHRYEVSAIPRPTQRKRQDTTATSTQTLPTSLYASILSGPYSKRLLTQNYTELTNDIGDFLNQDWLLHPQMRYACSRALAGMILLDTVTDHSLIVNSIGIYGRTRSLDSHREMCRTHHHNNNNINNSTAPTTSLPPETCRYRHVWPTTLKDSDGMKLVIGTKTFNALVTSSLHLDIASDPNIGPSTTNFVLNTAQQSLTVQLFVKETAWTAATTLAMDPTTSQMTPYDSLGQLRQLRTRFHHLSTYLRCRSSNEATDDVSSRPFTIFTLADWNSGRDNLGYRLASKLFQVVAGNIMKQQNRLDKAAVLALTCTLTQDSEYATHLNSILALFGEGTDGIDIIGNAQLNGILEKMADLLTRTIPKANESIRNTIVSSFKN